MVAILDGPIAARFPGFKSRNLRIAEQIDDLRKLPQVEMPLTHRFQDGVYIREIFMPAQTLPQVTIVAGAVHATKHLNIVLTGRALVSIGDESMELKAGDVFESAAGAQKFLCILEDCRWITIHANPDEERDIAKLEERITVLPDAFLQAKGSMTLDEFRMSVNKSLNS